MIVWRQTLCRSATLPALPHSLLSLVLARLPRLWTESRLQQLNSYVTVLCCALSWQRRGKHPDLVKQLMMSDMLKYRLHEAPYTSLPADGELSTLKLYWQNISRDDDKAQLPWLALFLLDIKPHAADPEKTFSLMGWIHSARRSQLASKTTTALAMVKMSYNSQRARDRQVTPQLICFITSATRLSCSWLIHLVDMTATGVYIVMNNTMHSFT